MGDIECVVVTWRKPGRGRENRCIFLHDSPTFLSTYPPSSFCIVDHVGISVTTTETTEIHEPQQKNRYDDSRPSCTHHHEVLDSDRIVFFSDKISPRTIQVDHNNGLVVRSADHHRRAIHTTPHDGTTGYHSDEMSSEEDNIINTSEEEDCDDEKDLDFLPGGTTAHARKKRFSNQTQRQRSRQRRSIDGSTDNGGDGQSSSSPGQYISHGTEFTTEQENIQWRNYSGEFIAPPQVRNARGPDHHNTNAVASQNGSSELVPMSRSPLAMTENSIHGTVSHNGSCNNGSNSDSARIHQHAMPSTAYVDTVATSNGHNNGNVHLPHVAALQLHNGTDDDHRQHPHRLIGSNFLIPDRQHIIDNNSHHFIKSENLQIAVSHTHGGVSVAPQHMHFHDNCGENCSHDGSVTTPDGNDAVGIPSAMSSSSPASSQATIATPRTSKRSAAAVAVAATTPTGNNVSAAAAAAKRRQVKQACVACRKMHAACDEQRPCKRCIRNGLADSCVDAPPKRVGKRAAALQKNGDNKYEHRHQRSSSKSPQKRSSPRSSSEEQDSGEDHTDLEHSTKNNGNGHTHLHAHSHASLSSSSSSMTHVDLPLSKRRKYLSEHRESPSDSVSPLPQEQQSQQQQHVASAFVPTNGYPRPTSTAATVLPGIESYPGTAHHQTHLLQRQYAPAPAYNAQSLFAPMTTDPLPYQQQQQAPMSYHRGPSVQLPSFYPTAMYQQQHHPVAALNASMDVPENGRIATVSTENARLSPQGTLPGYVSATADHHPQSNHSSVSTHGHNVPVAYYNGHSGQWAPVPSRAAYGSSNSGGSYPLVQPATYIQHHWSPIATSTDVPSKHQPYVQVYAQDGTLLHPGKSMVPVAAMNGAVHPHFQLPVHHQLQAATLQPIRISPDPTITITEPQQYHRQEQLRRLYQAATSTVNSNGAMENDNSNSTVLLNSTTQ